MGEGVGWLEGISVGTSVSASVRVSVGWFVGESLVGLCELELDCQLAYFLVHVLVMVLAKKLSRCRRWCLCWNISLTISQNIGWHRCRSRRRSWCVHLLVQELDYLLAHLSVSGGALDRLSVG